jgi:hypothetical protein
MADFETIVRPFQRREVALPTRIFDASETPPTPVHLTLGIAGEGKIFNESFSSHVTTFNETKSEELSRDTHKKRITNPDDSSQFVDVEVIDKLRTEEGEGRNYKKLELKLKNSG